MKSAAPSDLVVNCVPLGDAPPDLVEVDLIYPDSGSASSIATFTASGDEYRFWTGSAGGTPIIDDGASQATGGDLPTVLYGEAIFQSPSDPITFTYNGHVATASPVGVSVSVNSLPPADPDADIDLDSSSDPYTTVHLNKPSALANGATVTLSIDPAIANDVEVYQGIPGATGSTIILGGTTGATSTTWTVGSTTNPPPTSVYAVGLDAGELSKTFFTLTITAEADTQPANDKPAVAPQAAAVGTPGHLVAFDGTQDETKDSDTVIWEFEQHYIDKAPGGPTYEKGTATTDILKDKNNLVAKEVNKFLRVAELVILPIGFKEMLARVESAASDIDAYYENGANDTVPLDVIGYSRGGIEADMLINVLENDPDIKVDGGQKTFAQGVSVRFVGLVAPVGSIKGDPEILAAKIVPLPDVDWKPIAPEIFPKVYKAAYLALADDKNYFWGLKPNLTVLLKQWDTILPAQYRDDTLKRMGHIQIGHDIKGASSVLQDLEAAAKKAGASFK